MVVKHIVLFKVRKDVEPAAVTALSHKLHGLKAIEGVQSISFGETFTTERNQGFTHALVVDMQDKETLDRYSKDAGHVEVVKTSILPIIEAGGLLAMDFEVPSSRL
eukprot:jgi/Hompol1/2911/HPOL_003063-RA